MRDLHKTKVIGRWKTKSGVPLMQVREGKRQAKYVCFMIEVPKPRPPGLLGSVEFQQEYAPRDLRDLRMGDLRKAAQTVATYLEEDQVYQQTAELALDLIYAELNRRLNK